MTDTAPISRLGPRLLLILAACAAAALAGIGLLGDGDEKESREAGAGAPAADASLAASEAAPAAGMPEAQPVARFAPRDERLTEYEAEFAAAQARYEAELAASQAEADAARALAVKELGAQFAGELERERERQAADLQRVRAAHEAELARVRAAAAAAEEEAERERNAPPREPTLFGRARSAEVALALGPFVEPGYAQLDNSFGEVKLPFSLRELQATGALQPTLEGWRTLYKIASSRRDLARTRWPAEPGVSGLARVQRAQELLIELGPALVELGKLRP